jgi:hypothetical protein
MFTALAAELAAPAAGVLTACELEELLDERGSASPARQARYQPVSASASYLSQPPDTDHSHNRGPTRANDLLGAAAR